MEIHELGQTEAYNNYYNVPEAEEGIIKVSSFKKITYSDLYPNIDLEFYIPEDPVKPVEYNFIIHPQGNIDDIKMKISGAMINLESGSLEMQLVHGKMKEIIPASWTQTENHKTPVAIEFRKLEENIFGFCYSLEHPKAQNEVLTIDPTPVREWATYFGGSEIESYFIGDVASDANSNSVIVGHTSSHNNIATSGPPESFYDLQPMGYIAKFDPSGTLLWSSYYGGYMGAVLVNVTTDRNNNIITVGNSSSINNMSTPGAHQPLRFNADDEEDNYPDGIMAKFDPNGLRIWGTYFGGESFDGLVGVIADDNNNIYTVGSTASHQNIATPGSFMETGDADVHGHWNGILAKFTPSGTRLWSTFYSGEEINDLALDSAGNVYFVGSTYSFEGIATPGAYQEEFNYDVGYWSDAFIGKFNPGGDRVWGTYFGGFDYEFGQGIAIDSKDNVIISGQTRSFEKIGTPGAHQETKGGDYNDWDAFLAKFDSGGNLSWSTFYGGSNLENWGFYKTSIDVNDNIFLFGNTNSDNNISTPNAFQTQKAEGADLFLVKFSEKGERTWGTYYGGNSSDYSLNIDITAQGEIFLIGWTYSTSGISTPGAHQENAGGNDDAFLIKLKDCLSAITAEAPAGVCEGEDIKFTATGGLSYLWSGPNGFSSASSNPTIPAAGPEASGTYAVSVISGAGCDDTRTFEVVVSPRPVANAVSDVTACEEEKGSGISSLFDLSGVESQILGSQIGMEISYYKQDGSFIGNNLPNPYTNTTTNKETLIARVAIEGNPSCYTETIFDLIVTPKPEISIIDDLVICDNDTDGIAETDLRSVTEMLTGNNSGLSVSYINENGIPVVLTDQGSYTNSKPFRETLTARLTLDVTECYSEIEFDLVINPLAIAHPLQQRIGCDDDNDGISEYFDLSGLEAEVLQGQTGLQVSYYRSDGSEITGMPSPYTNLQRYEETMWVRVGDPQTGCYAETSLTLKTSAAPVLNTPMTFYSCDAGFGIGSFDTSAWNQNIIGNQTGLKVTYYTQSGNALPTPLPALYSNAVPNTEKITAKVENELNSLCVSETSFDLSINEKQELIIQETYNLCDLEPFLNLKPGGNFDTWEWKDVSGTVISNTAEASLTAAGNYSVTVSKMDNGMSCESSYSFKLIRSQLPIITEVKYQEWSSNNFIEIISGGEGNLEYSIDGINFQDSNYFGNIPGGNYTVFARDKMGCGMASAEVVLIDYPKYFTPNNDGYHDHWQIKGIATQAETYVLIYDRYGKLLKEMSSLNQGWDGSFNGKIMPADDYWFSIAIEDGKIFKGHFSLIR